MTTVQSTVRWLESSLQSPPEFRITFESSQSKTSLSSSFPSAPPWPWPPCWPPCWPGGYWGRPRPGPGPHIYFIVWTFQIGRAAAGTEIRKICLFKSSIVCWADQDVKALETKLKNSNCEKTHSSNGDSSESSNSDSSVGTNSDSSYSESSMSDITDNSSSDSSSIDIF